MDVKKGRKKRIHFRYGFVNCDGYSVQVEMIVFLVAPCLFRSRICSAHSLVGISKESIASGNLSGRGFP